MVQVLDRNILVQRPTSYTRYAGRGDVRTAKARTSVKTIGRPYVTDCGFGAAQGSWPKVACAVDQTERATHARGAPAGRTL